MTDLPAGDALDVLVAEKVMGWKRGTDREGGVSRWCDASGALLSREHATPEGAGRGDFYLADESWSPSTDIRAAWEVVESHPVGTWNWRIVQEDGGRWAAEVRLGYASSYTEAFPEWADTAPLAICRAALAAVGATT